MIKIFHLIACSDYFARFISFKRAFSMKKVMLKNSRALHYANATLGVIAAVMTAA